MVKAEVYAGTGTETRHVEFEYMNSWIESRAAQADAEGKVEDTEPCALCVVSDFDAATGGEAGVEALARVALAQ
jgi:hypothetical protein